MHRTRNPANRFYRRAGSNPVLTLRFEEVIIWMLTSFSFLLALHKKRLCVDGILSWNYLY